MKKTSLLAVCLIVLFFTMILSVMAQTSDSEVSVGVDMKSDPGILPTNPFYFIKSWSRSIRQTLTFDPISKAKLELQFANEKIAEAKKVQDIQPLNTDKIVDAVKNYKDTQEKLKERLQNLGGNADSVEVNALISEVVNKSIKHERVLDEMAMTKKDNVDIQSAIESTREVIDNNMVEASLRDLADVFANTLENELNKSATEEFGNLKSIETIERVIQKVPENLRPALEKVRDNTTKRLEDEIKYIYEKGGANSLRQAMQKLPSVGARGIMIFNRIKPELNNKIVEVINSTEILPIDKPTM